MIGVSAHAILDVARLSDLSALRHPNQSLNYTMVVGAFKIRTLRSWLLLERVDDELQGTKGVPDPEGQAQDAEDGCYAFEVPGDGATGDDETERCR